MRVVIAVWAHAVQSWECLLFIIGVSFVSCKKFGQEKLMVLCDCTVCFLENGVRSHFDSCVNNCSCSWNVVVQMLSLHSFLTAWKCFSYQSMIEYNFYYSVNTIAVVWTRLHEKGPPGKSLLQTCCFQSKNQKLYSLQ